MWLNQKTHQNNQREILSLSQRISISLDVAYAMDYLHNQCASPLIHCDLKPSNILLDLDMVAYVSDFGLARFQCNRPSAHEDNPTSFAGLKGSIGYIPPGDLSQNLSSRF
jgi:serine/threonine protein kinase